LIKLRLQRKGRIRRPYYHIVVADSRAKRDGRIIEQVGRYDNVSENKEVVLNEDRIMYWLDTGAQPTDTVRNILRDEGVLYKRHLIRWGKSEQEIEAAMNEWASYRASKQEEELSKKDKMKDVLAAEEKSFKEAIKTKSAKAAEELAAEEASAEVEEAVDEVVAEEEVAEEIAEETTEAATEESTEAVVEAEAEAEAQAETEAEAEAEEAVEEETGEVETPEAEEEPAEEEVAETAAEETAETEAPEETKEEAVEEAEAEAPSSEGPVSTDMTAKEAISHISNTDLEELKGFVPDSEDRKTVLAAGESKNQ
jgi:small subunit ribosomal protein S16